MKILQHKFVEFIPTNLEEGLIYISIEYRTAIHKCVCGCGNQVVTPISPTDWRISFNGKSISLYPSIGNWGFDCKSHYWITDNKIKFAEKFTEKEIEIVRKKDKKNKWRFFKVRKWITANYSRV
jgi:hypothetical protein